MSFDVQINSRGDSISTLSECCTQRYQAW